MKVALITARGGSKGLPRKNIINLINKPLIAWSIDAAIDCKAIDKVFVSTEDAEIAAISQEYGAEVIHRPEHLATDIASSDSVIEHAIQYFHNAELLVDSIVLLQPTSPLRNAIHIDEALALYEQSKADSVISVFEPSHTPIKAYIENTDGSMKGLYSNHAPYTRRQDLPRAFQPNGAIYIFSVDKFILASCIPRENVYPYVMSELDSADIDTIEDLNYVKNIIEETK